MAHLPLFPPHLVEEVSLLAVYPDTQVAATVCSTEDKDTMLGVSAHAAGGCVLSHLVPGELCSRDALRPPCAAQPRSAPLCSRHPRPAQPSHLQPASTPGARWLQAEYFRLSCAPEHPLDRTLQKVGGLPFHCSGELRCHLH